ncbi:unnamed protein product [Closterium sp. NIES-53]
MVKSCSPPFNLSCMFTISTPKPQLCSRWLAAPTQFCFPVIDFKSLSPLPLLWSPLHPSSPTPFLGSPTPLLQAGKHSPDRLPAPRVQGSAQRGGAPLVAPRGAGSAAARQKVLTSLIAALGWRYPDAVLQAMRLMMSQPSTWPDLPAYRAAAVALGRAGYLQELLQVGGERMGSENVDSGLGPTHTNRIAPLGTDGRGAGAGAASVASSTSSSGSKSGAAGSSWLAPDVVVYNAVLNACGAKRQWKGVQWVLQQMRSEGVAPDAATFGLAIQALSLCNQTHLALQLLADMEAAGFPPTTHTYRDLVRALAAAGRVEEAEEAVREMQERGMEGNAGVFHALACALCSAGRWRDAVALVEKISRAEDAQPAVMTWTGLIRACERSNHLDNAAQVFREMQKQGCTPNITTCNIMITVFARTGRFAAAEEIYTAARSGGKPIITGRKRWMSKEERQEARMQRLVANNRSRRRLIREGKLQREAVAAGEAGEEGREGGACEEEVGEEEGVDDKGEAIGVTGESEEQKCKEEEEENMKENWEEDREEDREENAGERVWMGRRREDPPLVPNSHTFTAMLGACVRCRQWQAVRQVARDMQRAGWPLQVRQHGWVVDALLKGKQTAIADELLLAMRGTATGAAGLSNSQESSRVSVHNPDHVASRDDGGVGGEESPPETVESVSEEEQRRTAAQQQLELLSALTRASSRGDEMSSQGVSDDSCENNSLSSSDSSSSSNSSIPDTSSSTQASSSSGKDSSSDELSPVLLRVRELLESHAPLDGFAWRYAVASVGGGLTGEGVEEAVGVMDAWGRALEGTALDERVVEERALEGKVVEERVVEVEVVSGEGRPGAVAGAYSAGVESGRAESSGVETASVQRGPARAADARTDLDTAASGAGAAVSGSAASGAVGAAGGAGDPGAAGAAAGGGASAATSEAYPASSPAVDPGVLADLVRGLLIGGKREEVQVALLLVDRMEKEGWVADAGIYTSLLHRTVRLGMGAEAREVLARAEAAGVKVEYDDLELSDSVGGTFEDRGERVGGGWQRGEGDRVEEPSAWDILKVWRKELL